MPRGARRAPFQTSFANAFDRVVARNMCQVFNYDKQYESYLNIVKSSGYVPKNKKEMEKLNMSKPAECGLPVFDKSPLCAQWDEFYATLE
eukprot:939510-Prorocentrum_minimum.AAC.1